MLWVCIGAPAQLIVVSAVWSWLPSFLVRTQGMAPQAPASRRRWSCSPAPSAVSSGVRWSTVPDVAAPRAKLRTVAALCLVTMVVISFAFGAPRSASLSGNTFALIVLGGLLMTCTVGPASAAVIDVTHPGVRSTGASILSLFQNLFGLALGPFVAGALSDSIGLEAALTITPLFGLIAVVRFARAATTYKPTRRALGEPVAAQRGGPTRNAGLNEPDILRRPSHGRIDLDVAPDRGARYRRDRQRWIR